MEVDTQAALAELNQEESPESTEQAPGAETPAPADFIEIPYNDQTLKLPLSLEMPVKHNGQIVNTPLDKLFNTYRQASNFEDKALELRQLREKIDTDRGDLEQYNQLKGKYEAIQNWSEQNPDQWNKLWDLFQSKDQYLLADQGQEAGLTPDHPIIKEISTLKNELNDLREFKSSFEMQQEEAQTQSDIEEVKQEIEEFRKEYQNINLDEKDLDGLSLQARIIKHGIDGNYPDFNSAALTYKFPDGTNLRAKLLENAQMRGRTEAVKAVKQDKADGVIARSSTPFEGQGSQADPRNLSEDDRRDMALNELSSLLGELS